MSVQEVHDAGDAQVALVRVRGTTPAPHDHLWGYLVRVQDGKLRFIRAFYDPGEALRAAGLRA